MSSDNSLEDDYRRRSQLHRPSTSSDMRSAVLRMQHQGMRMRDICEATGLSEEAIVLFDGASAVLPSSASGCGTNSPAQGNGALPGVSIGG